MLLIRNRTMTNFTNSKNVSYMSQLADGNKGFLLLCLVSKPAQKSVLKESLVYEYTVYSLYWKVQRKLSATDTSCLWKGQSLSIHKSSNSNGQQSFFFIAKFVEIHCVSFCIGCTTLYCHFAVIILQRK